MLETAPTTTQLCDSVLRGHEVQMIRLCWPHRHRRDALIELCGLGALKRSVRRLRQLGRGDAVLIAPNERRPKPLWLVPHFVKERSR